MKIIASMIDEVGITAFVLILILLCCVAVIIFAIFVLSTDTATISAKDCAEFAHYAIELLPARCLAYWMNQ